MEEEKTKQLILKLPEDIHTQLKTMAAQEKTTMVQLIKNMITKRSEDQK